MCLGKNTTRQNLQFIFINNKIMKLTQIKINNFRTICTELTVGLQTRVTVVGPNNSGKTNILKAIDYFFCSFKNNSYQFSQDAPFAEASDSMANVSSRTSIVGTFKISEDEDNEFVRKYSILLSYLDKERDMSEYINLYLQYSTNNRASYRFIINEKIKSEKLDAARQLQDELTEYIFERFSCKYIPSEKKFNEIYNLFILPHLRESIGGLLQNQLTEVLKSLDLISNGINETMVLSGIDGIRCEFGIPGSKISEAISSIDFIINDGQKTFGSKKGSGIQAALLFACLEWITKREILSGKNVIWLVEEPESYLHPGLIPSCNRILDKIAETSSMLVTTHALGFIGGHEKTLGISRSFDGTVINKFKSYSEATAQIRSALGVRFSDYFNLSDYNLFVEGVTDKLIIEKVLSLVSPTKTKNKFYNLRKSKVIDLSGVSKLKDFLKSTYSKMREEVHIAIVFDGDNAGKIAVQDLGEYFGKKSIPFQSNKEYFVLPNGLPIEGMFPSNWLDELESENKSWISRRFDIDNKVIDIRVPDDKKMKVASWLLARAEKETSASGHYAWAANFLKLFDVVEKNFEERPAAYGAA